MELDEEVVSAPQGIRMNGPVLEAVNLHKRYGDLDVLGGVSFSVDAGQVKVILGASGSGKSTILRLMNVLEPADSGTILLDGRVLGVDARGKQLPERKLARERREIGMVFQRFNLFNHLTALDNVASGLTLALHMSRRDAREKAMAMLERVGLAGRSAQYPSELSGGQQQRVAIARALVMEPRVMLFDEPTSALDPELVGEVLAVMETLASEGMTMVVVTHETRFARRVADEVALFHAGRIVEVAAPDRFFDAPETDEARRYLSHVS